MTNAPLLSISDLRTYFYARAKRAFVRSVDGVSLSVHKGDTLGIVGESGSGKTTLLRLFNRMVDPSAGKVRVEGRPVSELDPIALRRRIGYVPQDGGLIPHWRVERTSTRSQQAGGAAAKCAVFQEDSEALWGFSL